MVSGIYFTMNTRDKKLSYITNSDFNQFHVNKVYLNRC